MYSYKLKMDTRLKFGDTVYHMDMYEGREPLKVIRFRRDEIELEGDFSGGTHNVCQADWFSMNGLLLESMAPTEKKEAKENNQNETKKLYNIKVKHELERKLKK